MHRALLFSMLVVGAIFAMTATTCLAQNYDPNGRVLQVTYGGCIPECHDMVNVEFQPPDNGPARDAWIEAVTPVGARRPAAGDVVTCSMDDNDRLTGISDWYSVGAVGTYEVYPPVYDLYPRLYVGYGYGIWMPWYDGYHHRHFRFEPRNRPRGWSPGGHAWVGPHGPYVSPGRYRVPDRGMVRGPVMRPAPRQPMYPGSRQGYVQPRPAPYRQPVRQPNQQYHQPRPSAPNPHQGFTPGRESRPQPRPESRPAMRPQSDNGGRHR